MRKAVALFLAALMLFGSIGLPAPAWSEGQEAGAVQAEAAAPEGEAPAGEGTPVAEAPVAEAPPAPEAPAEAAPTAQASPEASGEAAPAADGTPAAEAGPAPASTSDGEAPAASETPAAEGPAAQGAPASEATPAAEGAPAGEAGPAPAGEATPAPAGEASPAPAGEASPAPAETPTPPAARNPVFSGQVVEVTETGIRVQGKGPQGEDLTMAFLVDPETQVAQGLKAGDTVVVYYEVVAGGQFRASSARFPENGLPENVFPPAAGETPAPGAEEETPPPAAEEQVPRVVNIEIEGNQQVPTEEVLAVISTRIGDPVLEPRIRRDMQAIFDLGYFTDVRLDTRYAPGGVRLVYRVLENPVVQNIDISGNSVVPTEKIRELMETKTGQILNTRTLHSDIQAINKYYDEELGYLLTPTHITTLDFQDGQLKIVIQDGMIVKDVQVKGVTVFSKEEVQALVQTAPGQLFNRNTLREDSDRIAQLYEKNDYILDTIRPAIDPQTGEVSLNVIEAVLERIEIQGNTKTKDDTIVRNIRTKPGEVLQRKKLQRDLERLNNLGYFKKVEPEIEPGTNPGQVVLLLKVEEQKTGLATLGVGYAGGGSGAVRPGITGAVSFSDRNLFGEGKSASINLQRGANIGTYGVSYFDPAINDAQESIGFTIFYNEVSGLQQPVPGGTTGQFALYQDRRWGGTLTFGHPFTDDFRGFITARRETIEITEDPASDFTPIGLGKGDLNSVAFSTLYDTRDDVFNPHVGSYGNGSFSVAGTPFGGDFNYNKLLVEGRHYLPLSERQTIALRAMYGSVNGGAPVSELFYVGGTDTLRGYQDNSFFGNRMILLNAEYRFPIANLKMLNGAVFADAGNAWFPGVTPSKLFTDAGIGLRIVFPTLGLGVIRIDYAFGERGSRSTIGIGQSF